MGARHSNPLDCRRTAAIHRVQFHCINIELHKHSVVRTRWPGPWSCGRRSVFLIADASYTVTHQRSGENSWSPRPFGLQGFSLISTTQPPTPGGRVQRFRCAGRVRPCTHTNTLVSKRRRGPQVVLHRSDAPAPGNWASSSGFLTHWAARALLMKTFCQIKDFM